MTSLAEKLIEMGIDKDSFMVIPRDSEFKDPYGGPSRPVFTPEMRGAMEEQLRDKNGQRDTDGVIGYNNGFVAVYDGDQYIVSADKALGQALEKEGFKDRGLGVIGSNHEHFASGRDNELFEKMTTRCKEMETGETEIKLAEKAQVKSQQLEEDIKKSNKLIEELNQTKFQSKFAAEDAEGLSASYEKVMAANTEYVKSLVAKGKKPNMQINAYLESMLKDASAGKKTEAENPLNKKAGFFKGLFSKKDKAEEAQLAALRQELAGLQESLLKNPALVKECLQAMQADKASVVAHMAETLKTKASEYKAKEQEAASRVSGEKEKNSALIREKTTLDMQSDSHLADAKIKVSERLKHLSEDRGGESQQETSKLSTKLASLSGRQQKGNTSREGTDGKAPVRQVSSQTMAATARQQSQR